MKTFLEELATNIYRSNPQLDKLVLVFPNRRAILYFQKHLSAQLTRPAFAPQMLTIEDFIAGFSEYKVPDKLELVHRLYHTYMQVVPATNVEAFDQFFFWGEMLLRDFNEVDKYLVSARHLFLDLSAQKELDNSFDFLTDEQREFLKLFWGNFDENLNNTKRNFLRVWKELNGVYEQFKTTLQHHGLAYEGMVHRLVATRIDQRPQLVVEKYGADRSFHFIGFNALTKAEEVIFSALVKEELATVHWDMDAYYVNNNTQEAGKFLREYQQHPLLSRTFPAQIPSNFVPHNDDKKNITLYGAAQPVGQAKLMAQVLQEALMNGARPEETLIVLPDEKMLIPVLNGISHRVDKLNVTMGFPLTSTPVFNLMELVIELQLHRKADRYQHRQVLALLGHPYVVADNPSLAQAKRKEILKKNMVFIDQRTLAFDSVLHQLLFRPASAIRGKAQTADRIFSLYTYLRDLLLAIGTIKALPDIDREYAFHFLKLLNRLEEIISEEAFASIQHEPLDAKALRRKDQEALKSFLRLFKQLVNTEKIPFTGEPLRGLQIMGVLETRNLDYKNVFILSLNEGAFPAVSSKGSYIPFNIRKAYALPTAEHQDAMYAYLFYRTLQRAENIHLFYNTETDKLGQGEKSRYLQQLIYESGLQIVEKTLYNPLDPEPVLPVTIEKDKSILQIINRFNERSEHRKSYGISPSALYMYLECRLKFYFQYVADIREAREVEEELDARLLGNLLHSVMDMFYNDICTRKKSKLVEPSDLENEEHKILQLIDQAFRTTYALEADKAVEYEGQRVVVREVIKRLVLRIIERDKLYAPFYVEGLEQEGLTARLAIPSQPGYCIISGTIDRVDVKDELIRIIDYKTGKDDLNFSSVSLLFEREGKKQNKAAFQTLFYALLYKHNLPEGWKHGAFRIMPVLINRMNLFDEDFEYGLRMNKEILRDATAILPEFETLLKALLNELFDPAVPFTQTNRQESCQYCPYKSICSR